MDRTSRSTAFVGNDFIVPQPKLRPLSVAPAPIPATPVISVPIQEIPSIQAISTTVARTQKSWRLHGVFEYMHRYSVATFAILILLVGTSGIHVGGMYYSAQKVATNISQAQPAAKAISGLNITVPDKEFTQRIATITAQKASITVGENSIPIDAATIQNWLRTTQSPDGTKHYVQVMPARIETSLLEIANRSVKDPVNEIVVTYPDGGRRVIASGRDGVALANPADLKLQAITAAKTVLDGKGLQFNAPLQTRAFASVTPASFDKLIEVNIATKQMYLYEKGQLFRTYAISAGAPATPTPIGQFKIYSKLSVQDMRGYNADGSKYFQPHVRWVNYFLPGGYAVHGNYWRPASVFGSVNTSHGCVSLPDSQAKEVYDWAPLGTTVVTHT